MRSVILSVFVIAAVSAGAVAAGQDEQTFTGTITDSECYDADHSFMQMGPTDAECVEACIIAHGAAYVLYDGENVYELSDQQAPKQFAAQRVVVTGTLDSETRMITVASMIAAR
jgi:hypothetical protein